MADEVLQVGDTLVDAYRSVSEASSPEFAAYVSTVPLENSSDYLKGGTKTYSMFDFENSAFVDGFKTSPIGMWYRRGGRFTADKYQPTEEEKKELYAKFNYNKEDIDFVLDNARTYEDVKQNMDLLAENRRIEAQFNDSPWYMGLVGGIGSGFGNPVDLVTTAGSFAAPPLAAGRVATWALRLGANVASGVASNQLQEYVSGIHHDVWTDVGAITAMTLGIDGVGKGMKRAANVGRRVALAHDAMIRGQNVPAGTSKLEKSLAEKLNNFREQMTSKLPSVEFKQRLLGYMNKSNGLHEYIRKLTHWEQGLRDEDAGIKFKQRLTGPGENTLFDEVEGLRIETDSLMNTLANDMAKLSKAYNREDVNDFLYKKISGEDVSSSFLADDPLANDLAKRISAAYQHRGIKLNNSGLVDAGYNIAKYIPVVIDRWKMHDFISRIGDDATAGTYLQSYLYIGAFEDASRIAYFKRAWKEELEAQQKKEAEEALKRGETYTPPKMTQQEEDLAFNNWLWEEAGKAGYGYRDQAHTSNSVDNFEDDAHDFSFQKRRMPWNTAYEDGSGFSLDSLRGDIVDVSTRYFNRTAGLLAEKRVYDRDFREGSEHIKQLADEYWVDKTNRKPGGEDELREALTVMHRRAYGMAINPDRANFSMADAFTDIMKNLAFASYGTLMGVLNYGEVGAAIQAYGAGALIRMLPGVHETVQRWGSGLFSKEDIEAIKDHLIGREMYDTLAVDEIIRRNEERYRQINPYLAKAVGISQVIADYSPAAQLQRYANNTIIDTVVSCFLGEFMQKAYGRKTTSRGFLRDLDLARVGVLKDDLEYTLKAARRYMKYDEASKTPMLKSADLAWFRDDDRAMGVLRKLTNYAIEETLQRRKLDDIFTWQTANNPVLSMALQFKSFAIQSYNKRFVKFMNRWEEEGNLAALNSYLTTSALTGAITLAQTNLKALGMDEEEKEAYLQGAAGIGSIEDLSDPDALATFLMNALFNRNPYTASMALAMNTVGIGTSAKSTSQIRDKLDEEDESGYLKWNGIANTTLDMFPALRFGESLAFGGIGAYNRARDFVLDDSTYKDRKDTARYIKRSMSAIPNLPGITNLFKSFVNEDLEDYKYGY